jgi:hypothetical protein
VKIELLGEQEKLLKLLDENTLKKEEIYKLQRAHSEQLA